MQMDGWTFLTIFVFVLVIQGKVVNINILFYIKSIQFTQ